MTNKIYKCYNCEKEIDIDEIELVDNRLDNSKDFVQEYISSEFVDCRNEDNSLYHEYDGNDGAVNICLECFNDFEQEAIDREKSNNGIFHVTYECQTTIKESECQVLYEKELESIKKTDEFTVRFNDYFKDSISIDEYTKQFDSYMYFEELVYKIVENIKDFDYQSYGYIPVEKMIQTIIQDIALARYTSFIDSMEGYYC